MSTPSNVRSVGSGIPMIARTVTKTSTVETSSRETAPDAMRPGHRAIAGTRRLDSHDEPSPLSAPHGIPSRTIGAGCGQVAAGQHEDVVQPRGRAGVGAGLSPEGQIVQVGLRLSDSQPAPNGPAEPGPVVSSFVHGPLSACANPTAAQ